MATELAAAYVTIIPSLKGAAKSIQGELGGVNTSKVGSLLGNKLSGGFSKGLGSIGSAFGNFAKIGAKAFAVINGGITGIAIHGGISRALKLEQANSMFKGLGFTAEQVASAMNSANKAVDGTAFGLDAAAQAAALLSTSGVQLGDDMDRALQAIAGTATMAGTSMEDVTDIFQVVAAKGKLGGDELNRLNARGVNAVDALSKHLGKTQEEVRDLVSKGKIDFKTFSDAMYESFGTAAQGANDTFSGALANVRAALSRIGAEFAAPALESLRRVFAALIPALKAVQTLVKPLAQAFGSFADNVAHRVEVGLGRFTTRLNNSEGVMAAFGAMWRGMFEFPGSPIRGMADDVGNLMGRIKAFGSEHLAAGLHAFMAEIEASGSPLRAFGALFKEAFAFEGGFLSEIGSSFARFFESFRTGTPLVAAFSEAFSWVSQNLGAGLDSAIESVRAKMESLPAPVQSVIAHFAELGAKASAFVETSGVKVSAFAAMFAGALAKFGGPLEKALSGAGAAIARFGTQAFSNIGKVGTLLASVRTAGGGLSGLATVISGLVNPVGLAVAAIAALAAGFAYLMATNEEFRTNVLNLVGSIAASLAPAIQTIVETVMQLAATLLPVIMSAISSLLPVIGQVVTAVLGVVAALAPVIADILQVVVPVLAEIISAVVQFAASVISAVMPVVEMILGVISDVMPVIVSAVSASMEVILSVIETVWPAIQAVIETVMGVISGVIAAVSSAIQGDWDGVWNAVKGIFQTVWNGIKGIASNAMAAVSGVISGAVSTVQGIWSNAWSTVTQVLSSAWDRVRSTVASGVGGLLSAVGEIPGKIRSLFSDAGQWLVNSGKSMIDGLVRGIQGAIGGALGAVRDAVGQIRNLFPFSPAKEGPFSGRGWVYYSGISIMDALGEGALSRAGKAVATMNGVMASVADAITPVPVPEPALEPQLRTAAAPARPVSDFPMNDVISLLAEIRDKDTGLYVDGRRMSRSQAANNNKALAHESRWARMGARR